MTEIVPAQPERKLLPVAAPVDVDSWVEVVRPLMHLADTIAETEFVPKGLRTKAKCAAAMLYGREVGLAPMTSLSMLHVVEGKPGMSAEGMRALVLAAGHEIQFVRSTGATCVMRGRRRGSEDWTEVEWTIDMARAAGLTGKNNWKGYPRRMLQARATSELAQMIWPDVIHGFRSIEELEDDLELNGSEDIAESATVQRAPRKRPAAKKAAPAIAAPANDLPPLPGEPGFEDGTEVGSESDAQGEGADDSDSTQDGPPVTPPADGPSGDPASPAGSPTPDDGGSEVDGDGTPDVVDSGPPLPGEQDEPPEDEGDVVNAEVVGEGPPPGARMPSAAMRRMMHGALGTYKLNDPAKRPLKLDVVGIIVGREITSTNDLTYDEMKTLLDAFGQAENVDQLRALVDSIRAAEAGTKDES